MFAAVCIFHYNCKNYAISHSISSLMIFGTRLDVHSMDATMEMELWQEGRVFVVACQHHLGESVS